MSNYKSIFKLIVIVGIFYTLSACSTRDSKPQTTEQKLSDSFIATVHQINPQEDTKKYVAYMLIPNTGCSGCINAAESVLKDTYQKAGKVKFILTNVISLKTVQVKLGINVSQNENILIDKDNLFGKNEFNSIYPQIFFIAKKDGSIIKKMEISPKEDGLSELTKLL